MPTINEVRDLVYKSHGKNDLFSAHTLDRLWTKHLKRRVSRYGNQFVDSAPKKINEQNSSACSEIWPTHRLRRLFENSREGPPKSGPITPVVIVKYRNKDCLIDGGQRITMWSEEGDPSDHEAWIVEIREPPAALRPVE